MNHLAFWKLSTCFALRNRSLEGGGITPAHGNMLIIALACLILTHADAWAQPFFKNPTPTPNISSLIPIWDVGVTTSRDELSMYFASRLLPDDNYPTGDFYMYVAERTSIQDDWGQPRPLPIELNQGGDASPSISADGLSLYFARGGLFGIGQGDGIYVATRPSVEVPWQSPQPVPGVNVGGAVDLTPEISSDGLELIFLSTRPGGFGNDDLWASRRQSLTDSWSEPVNLGSLVNTTGFESGPSLSANGLWLYFVTPGPDDGSDLWSTDFDIWVTHRTTTSSLWQPPVRLPDEINELSALEPHIAADGLTLYGGFTATESTDLMTAVEDMDIWQASLALSERPGDFNHNGELDVTDINWLSDEARTTDVSPFFDLNDDTLVNEADRQRWVTELAKTWFGDANLDGEFDSGDLVGVLAAGEYEDDVEFNSGWATGDWDGDGDFTSADLVAALADGGYEQGPRGVVAAVPEPSSAMLILLGMLGALGRRRSDAILRRAQ